MRRECQEEIGINPKDLRYPGHSEVSACFYAYLLNEEVSQLVLGEGQEIRFFDPLDMLELNMTPKLHELVHVYKDNLLSLIGGNNLQATDFGLIL